MEYRKNYKEMSVTDYAIIQYAKESSELRKKLKVMQAEVRQEGIKKLQDAITTDPTKISELWEAYQDDLEESDLLELIYLQVQNPEANDMFMARLLTKLDPEDTKKKLTYQIVSYCAAHNWKMLRFFLNEYKMHMSFCLMEEQKDDLEEKPPLVFCALKERNLNSLVVLYLSNPRHFECTIYKNSRHFSVKQIAAGKSFCFISFYIILFHY
jgi:hypothetical protein